MLSDEEFVRMSLELNLFFLRILKEHSLFLDLGFTKKDYRLSQQAGMLMEQFSRLLATTVSLANGNISADAVRSGEFVTEYTLDAERLTQYYTNTPINFNITTAELSLEGNLYPDNLPMLTRNVYALNHGAITAANSLIAFKTLVLDSFLQCRIFTTNYPLLIDHIRREAILYVSMLTMLQNRQSMNIGRFMVEQEAFWNRIMAEHAEFIRGLLDPEEEVLIDAAENFGKEFDVLTQKAIALAGKMAGLPQITEESLEATRRIKEFKEQGTEGLLACKIRSIIIPLLGDHVLREANHYIRLLKMFPG